MIAVHHGRAVLAWSAVATKINNHSIRKSLVGALIGVAVDEGRMRLTDALADMGIEDDPTLTGAECTATL